MAALASDKHRLGLPASLVKRKKARFPWLFQMEAGGIEQHSKSLGMSSPSARCGSYLGADEKRAPEKRLLTACCNRPHVVVDGILEPTEYHPFTATNLDNVVKSWPLLPPHIQESILALIDAVQPRKSDWTFELTPSVQPSGLANGKKGENSRTRLSSTILKALRHTPELFALHMNSDGWVGEQEFGVLLAQLIGVDEQLPMESINDILCETGLADRVQNKNGFVRAAYGHSTPIFVPTESSVSDQPLFHGTSADNWSMIECFGLSPRNRRFIQLTTDFEYANEVALSRGRSPIIIQIATAEAISRGVQFYSTGTHVWLSTEIPADCLQVWLDNFEAIENRWP